jgi:hypothetical protein
MIAVVERAQELAAAVEFLEQPPVLGVKAERLGGRVKIGPSIRSAIVLEVSGDIIEFAPLKSDRELV